MRWVPRSVGARRGGVEPPGELPVRLACGGVDRTRLGDRLTVSSSFWALSFSSNPNWRASGLTVPNRRFDRLPAMQPDCANVCAWRCGLPPGLWVLMFHPDDDLRGSFDDLPTGTCCGDRERCYESLFQGLVMNAAHRLLARPSCASVSMMGPKRSPLGSYSECFPPR